MANIFDFTNALPTLMSMLKALDTSPPIVACQYEIWYSQWPKSRFFAMDINVPGVINKVLPVYHSGIETNLIINSYYSSYEIEMTILDDVLGINYAYWRDLVIAYSQDGFKGKPIIDGRLNEDRMYQGASYVVVKLVNDPRDKSQHIWRLHNFKPTKIGDMQLGAEKKNLVSFTVTGTFTHITFVQDPEDAVALSEVGQATEVVQASFPTPQQPPAEAPEAPPAETPEAPPENGTPETPPADDPTADLPPELVDEIKGMGDDYLAQQGIDLSDPDAKELAKTGVSAYLQSQGVPAPIADMLADQIVEEAAAKAEDPTNVDPTSPAGPVGPTGPSPTGGL